MQASAIALWLNSFFAVFDQNIATAVHKLFDLAGWFFTPFFEFVSFLGKDGIILIILSFALIYFKKTRRFGTAMLLSVAIGALFTNCFLKIVIARPRPYTDGGFFQSMWMLMGQHVEGDKSFPSGHTCAAFATMTAVFLVGDRHKSWTAFIFAVLMGISRIYLVVHYASDVLGGMIVGTLSGFTGYKIYKILPEFYFELDLLTLFLNIVSHQKGKHEKK